MKKLFILLLLILSIGGVVMGQATQKEVDLMNENAELRVKYTELQGEFNKLRTTYNDALKSKIAELETEFNEYKMNVALQYSQKELELHKQYLGASDSTKKKMTITNETIFITLMIGFIVTYFVIGISSSINEK